MRTFKEFRQASELSNRKHWSEATTKKPLTAKEKRLKKLKDLSSRPESWKNLQ